MTPRKRRRRRRRKAQSSFMNGRRNDPGRQRRRRRKSGERKQLAGCCNRRRRKLRPLVKVTWLLLVWSATHYVRTVSTRTLSRHIHCCLAQLPLCCAAPPPPLIPPIKAGKKGFLFFPLKTPVLRCVLLVRIRSMCPDIAVITPFALLKQNKN